MDAARLIFGDVVGVFAGRQMVKFMLIERHALFVLRYELPGARAGATTIECRPGERVPCYRSLRCQGACSTLHVSAAVTLTDCAHATQGAKTRSAEKPNR